MNQGPRIPRGAPGRQTGPGGLRPLPAGTLKPGAVVFFPVAKKSTKANSEPLVFRGHGFGVFLGVVPQFAVEPTREMMDTLLSGVGWVSFENVFEMLGEEQFRILEQKFRAKYELEAMTEEEAKAEPTPATPLHPPPEKTLLVSRDGTPLVAGNPSDSEIAGPREEGWK